MMKGFEIHVDQYTPLREDEGVHLSQPGGGGQCRAVHKGVHVFNQLP